MACRTFSGTEIAKALGEWNFERVGQTSSHLKLRYINPDTGEKRTVVVPLHDELEYGNAQMHRRAGQYERLPEVP
jgi:predicted RNA binding protein YcfA (HicA-like mRNA interferase family)